MKSVNVVEGSMVSLPRTDVDTDQIIPQVHLNRVERNGYGGFLFERWAEDTNFPLNDPDAEKANVLVTGANFGCGSSREHAVWALMDRGFDAVIAPSFADIFSNNSLNNGLLLVRLAESAIAQLHETAKIDGHHIHISVQDETVTCGDNTWPFEIDDESKRRLIGGLDMIGVTLEYEDAIASYEATAQ